MLENVVRSYYFVEKWKSTAARAPRFTDVLLKLVGKLSGKSENLLVFIEKCPPPLFSSPPYGISDPFMRGNSENRTVSHARSKYFGINNRLLAS